METKIIKIGNSKGLRLGKTIIEKYEIGDSVNLRLESDHIVIEPLKPVRSNWGALFAEMRKNNDDKLLMDDFFEEESHWE